MRITREHIRFLTRVLEDHPASRADEGRDLLEVFREELNQGETLGLTRDHTGELVELIASLLMESDTRNALGGDTLNALRRAILLPRELATADRLVKEKSRYCSACGHKFADTELASYFRGSFLCVDCVMPNLVGCRRCNKPLSLPAVLNRVIPKLRKECPHCKEIAKNPPSANQPENGTTTVGVGGGIAFDEVAVLTPGHFTNVGRGAAPRWQVGPEQIRNRPRPTRANVENRSRTAFIQSVAGVPTQATSAPTPTPPAPPMFVREDGRPPIDPRLPAAYQDLTRNEILRLQQEEAIRQAREQQRIQDELRQMNQYMTEIRNPFEDDGQ